MRIHGFATAALLLAVVPASAQVINEIRIDQTGTDNDEYFELAGAAGTVLDGLSYIVVGDGSAALLSGVIESLTNLTGSIGASGLFLVAETTLTFPVTPDQSAGATGLNFENSDNVTHILVSGLSAANGADLDTNDDGAFDVPFGTVLDLIALIEEANPPAATELHYGPPTIGPELVGATPQVPGHVYRNPDGVASLSSGFNIGPFDAAVGVDTPGAPNVATRISASLGGTQALHLDAGAAFAGRFYLILTNFTGTSPGTPVPPLVLPLNFDVLFQFSLQNANTAVFSNTFGVLDANGRAAAAINFPVLPGAAGLTLNSAGAVLGPLLGGLAVTNAVPLALLP